MANKTPSESAKKKYHPKNYKRLQQLGLSAADIESYRNMWGVNINDDEYDRIKKVWNERQASLKAKEAALLERVPDFLKNDPSFKSLPADLKEITIYFSHLLKANDQQKAEALGKALEMATEQAEPYWKSMLLIAQDEILRTFEEAQGDYDSSLQRQQRIMRNINEDLTTNKDFLSLEQQSDLANLKRNYEIIQEQVIEGAAEKGLTFSTRRQLAEQRLAEENQGLVESTNRRYNKQLSDLQTAAGRDTEEAQAAIEDLERRMGTFTTDLGRSGEIYLGSGNLPALPGYQPIGDITGGMYEEQVADTAQRADTIYNELTQGSLNFS